MALLDVDLAAGTFDHRCEGCGLVRTGLRLSADLARGDLRMHVPPGRTAAQMEPEEGGLGIAACPVCNTGEGLVTHLWAEDEDESQPGNYAFRARQARLIRQMMAHPAVGRKVRGSRHAATATATAASGR